MGETATSGGAERGFQSIPESKFLSIDLSLLDSLDMLFVATKSSLYTLTGYFETADNTIPLAMVYMLAKQMVDGKKLLNVWFDNKRGGTNNVTEMGTENTC